MSNENPKFILRDPTKSEEYKQLVLEDSLDQLCKIAGREIFIMLPEDKDDRIPYLKKEIKKTLDLL